MKINCEKCLVENGVNDWSELEICVPLATNVSGVRMVGELRYGLADLPEDVREKVIAGFGEIVSANADWVVASAEVMLRQFRRPDDPAPTQVAWVVMDVRAHINHSLKGRDSARYLEGSPVFEAAVALEEWLKTLDQ